MGFEKIKETKANTDFTDKDFLNPSPSFHKYKNRDQKIGKEEARKREAIFNDIKNLSEQFSKENNFEPPELQIKGSTAVGMCTKESDLDIAVIIPLGHKFIRNSALWHKYSEFIKFSFKTEFEIQLQLIIKGVKDSTSYLIGM